MIKEAPPSYQIDSFEKLEFYPGMFEYMGRIAREMDYELLMVTNQDGLGTASFPEDTFWPVQNFVLNSLAGEGIEFSGIFIDRSFPEEKLPTRKPGTGMLTKYIGNEEYRPGEFVCDRRSDHGCSAGKEPGVQGDLAEQ